MPAESTVSTNIFGGSQFPGSISYSKALQQRRKLRCSGHRQLCDPRQQRHLWDQLERESSQCSQLFGGFPDGQQSIFGLRDQRPGKEHVSFAESSFGLPYAGFNMGAYYSKGGGHALIPEVVSGEQELKPGRTAPHTGFNVTHLLPLHGSVRRRFNRSDWNSNYLGSSSTGTIDTVNAVAAMHPTQKLSLHGERELLRQSERATLSSRSSRRAASIPGLNTNAVIRFARPDGNRQLHAVRRICKPPPSVERRTQTSLGETYGVNSYGGSATYAHKLLNGNFNAALTITENTSDNTGEDTLGFSTTENYSSRILRAGM